MSSYKESRYRLTPFNKDRKFGKKPFGKPDGRGPKRFGAGAGGFRRPEGRDFDRPQFDKPRFNKPGFDRQLFRATCANCGKECEVPFKPSGERPVFCRDCFQRQDHDAQPQAWHQRIRTSDYGNERKPRDFRNERIEPRPAVPQFAQELAAISVKLDRILKALDNLQPRAAAVPQPAEELTAEAKPKAARKKSAKRAAAAEPEVEETPAQGLDE
ncbi:MAG TPA: CxxC-x17-CxxC domain-containing protein [Candidatus Edwardsbacteria bacterium]|nr:CxxC-x17-CxxC domain-containing protein [Candidatus Edwardsbacteria bacterium]